MSQRRILEVYRQRQGWIARKRAHFAALANAALQPGDDQALLWGDLYRCRFEPGRQQVEIDSTRNRLCCPAKMSDPASFSCWHRQFATEYLRERARCISVEQGFPFNRLSIRNQRTRWGSCSSKQNISLNWRLVKAPVWVSDYVITHELVHTRIMNHSTEFWARVEVHCPRVSEAKSWLCDYGHTL